MTLLHRISEPSLGTVGTGTIATNSASRTSRINVHKEKTSAEKLRCAFLWHGRFRKYTLAMAMAPWNMVWQTFILLSIIYSYILQLILVHFSGFGYWWFWDVSLVLCDIAFASDLTIHILHQFWPLVRMHVRAYRRHILAITFDFITLIPFCILSRVYTQLGWLFILGRWLCICRIYRIFSYISGVNEAMHKSRKYLYVFEHAFLVALLLHMSACLWYSTHHQKNKEQPWHEDGFPKHVGSNQLKFDEYLTCWYYCACRLFNVIFGDSFPTKAVNKWITSILMLFGFVFIKYQFIGTMSWDLTIENSRRLSFIDQFHHMMQYLQFHGAPMWLIEQAQRYKLQLWQMKDGILTSNHLQQLPLPLQMELIFDINVGHFHSSLLFRDTGESFMRQISLLMKHEIFLEGQQIWTQGIVKSGMICVKRGVIEMLSDEDDESPIIAFKEGTVLGELSLFYSIPAKVTVKAATYVEVQLLKRTDFMHSMIQQTQVLNIIRRKIFLRLKESKDRQKAINKYDEGDSRLIKTRYRPIKVLKDNLAGIEDEDSTFADDSHLYFRDENNIRRPKFTPEYLELYQLSDKVTTINAPRICLRSTFPWILEPDTDFTHLFDIAHFIMVLYVCFVIPYQAILSNVHSDIIVVLNVVVKTGLLFQIYLQLTTAIFDKNVRRVTVQQIAEVKMASLGFYLDIISVFPMYIFTDTMDPQNETAAGQLALLYPVLQVWHLWNYMAKWEKGFYSNPKFICLMKYAIFFILLSYWSGCFLYVLACPRSLCREGSWIAQLIYWETKVFVTAVAQHEKQSLAALAFGTSIITGTGTSATAPGPRDLIVVVMLVIIGSYLISFYTAKLCSVYMLLNQRKNKFKESMRELFYFLSVNHVNAKIKGRVKKFFGVQWYYNSAVSTKELFQDMSTNIKQEVLSIEMVETLLYCPLFQECSQDFLQTVAANTRTIVLPDHEIVQHAADFSRDMYILQKGHCNSLNCNGKVVLASGPGSQFGVIEMLFGLPKVYTVVTTTNCILLHVEYSVLVQCLSTFPDIYHPINMILEQPEFIKETKKFEDATPMTGKIEAKINRLAQGIKESFVILNGCEDKAQYVEAFERLGVLRKLRYLFIPGCITPHGIFLKLWCALRLCLAVYYISIGPYNIASRHYKYGGTNAYTDAFLYIDLLVMAYVAYYDERSLLITHPLLTISHYLKHAFFLDLLTVFPFEMVFRIINDKTNVDLYRINRLLQVTRITGAFSYWESDIMRVNQAVVLLKFLPVAATIVNIITAVIFSNTCYPYTKPKSYFIYANCSRSLISNITYDAKYAVTEYIHTFYWIFEMFVGCGCTSVRISNTPDIWLMAILQIMGGLYFAFMFAYVASTRSSASTALLDHTEKIKDLADFLYQESVEPVLTAKTLKYFEYVWKRTNGSNPQQICRRLNSALMEDTLVFMYEKTLREVPLFGNMDRSFIRVITQHLNEMYFLKGETVVQCRDIQSYIYIIYRGKVDVLSSYNEMITCMGSGGMFGNFTGQPTSCSEVSIYASRSLDLLVIPSQTFFNLVKYYPKIQEPLHKAFEMSKDYILPITMDMTDDLVLTSDESDFEEKLSADSAYDSRSGSSRYELPAAQLSTRSSQSNVSQAKSGASITTFRSYNPYNIFKPGTTLFQGFGYLTCYMATANYILVLYTLITCNQCYVIAWLHGIFDIFFYIKTYFSLHQGYVNKNGDIIMDAAKCRRRYIKHKLRFWTDVIVNLPVELLCFCFTEPLKTIHYLRINKLFRIKYLLEFYRKTASELTNNITTLQTTMTFFVALLFIHTFTCIWLLVLTVVTPLSIIRTLKMHLLNDQNAQHIWDYTTSFYVMVSEITGSGGDEFHMEDIWTLTILANCFVCGKILAAIIVATSMQFANSTYHALNNYEKSTAELIDVLKNQGLSGYQLKKLWMYVQQLWVSERGRQLPTLLAQTPYVRRCDLMSAMFGLHLRNCYLFCDTGEPFLRQLTVVMDYTIFFPGNYIVVSGNSEARMYWVQSGTVSVVSVRSDLTESTHELLGPGDVFGIMQGLNCGVSHCFSYRAETKVSILTLSLDSWVHILSYFPEAKKVILERAEILFAQI